MFKKRNLFLIPAIVAGVISVSAATSISLAASVSPIDQGYEASNTLVGHKSYQTKKPRTHINSQNIPDTNIVFAENKFSEYKFLLKNKSDVDSGRFASYCKGNIYSAIGADVEIAYGTTAELTDKYIVVNNYTLMNTYGVEVDASLAISRGYSFTRKGNLVFVYAPTSECVQLASIKFSNCMVGYECLGNSTYIYQKNGVALNAGDKVMLPDFNLKEIPDTPCRVAPMGMSSNDRYDLGYTEYSTLIPVNGRNWHNCFSVLPLADFGTTHPKWYSNDRKQVCYTAHGDTDELEAMVAQVAESLIKAVINPTYSSYDRIGFFQADGAELCDCDACAHDCAYYGDGSTGLVRAFSGSMIKFMNLVADIFYNDSRIKNTDRENVNLGMFAYQDSCQAPINHLDEVQLNEKVTVYMAPSQLGGVPISWTEPILPEYGGIQAKQYENFEAWQKVCSNLGFWGYSTLFQNYLIPFDTFESMVEDARVAYDTNATWAQFQGEYTQEGHTGFTMFKNYICGKIGIDCGVEYLDLKNTYFSNFYDKAGSYMLQYFDELEEVNRNLRAKDIITGYLGQTFADPTTLHTFESVMHYYNLIEKALEEIEYLKSSNTAAYNKFKTNIEYEAIFPLYFLTVYYESKLNSELTAKFRQMLYTCCVDTKFSYYSELEYDAGKTLFSTLFKGWGF